jgi:hypothetical protein
MKSFIPQQKRIFRIVMLLAILDFILMIRPNAVASINLAMIRMFEPDEAAQLTPLLNMIAPADNLIQGIKNFVFYKYYFYGFPFFSISALAILPVKWLGSLANDAALMLVLRQVISVLPMLIALMFLVYLQDGFRTYRSVVLFLFLLSVPAVLANSFWWHVDSLEFLIIVLVIYFLVKDDLRFGKHFLIAAALTGCATATKLMGVYFFLAIATLLVIGLVQKKVPFKKLLTAALLFLGIMGLVYFICNPFLVSYWSRQEYKLVFNKQMSMLSEGYGVVYAKGLSQAWPTIHAYFGEWFFILAALAAVIWGIFKGPHKILHTVILTWLIPISISVIWFTHFKYQYWLPAALPLFSCLAVFLPEKLDMKALRKNTQTLIPLLVAAVLMALQFGLNLSSDVHAYAQRTARAEGNPEIAFYDQALTALDDLPDEPLNVYFDYRLYVPDTRQWQLETSYDLLSYDYVQEHNYDVLFLLQQRISDYLDPSASGIDPQQFANSQAFYTDANKGALQGYSLVFRNETGLVFVRNGISASSSQ